MLPDDPEALADIVVQAVDLALGPVLERLAAVDARLATLGDLRDKVVTLETKTAQPVPPDPLLDGRIYAVDARLTAAIDRLAAAEVKVAETAPILAGLTDLTKDVGALRERAAVLETRAPVPGPAGQNGKDGADGLGFGDLSLAQEDERTVIIRASRGDQVKDVGTLTLPLELYRGVYLEGKTYQRGDCVTWAGSEWHGNETTTTKPGEGSKAWTLKVKRGRDGRDGRDAPGALPVVAVGGGR